MKVLVTGGAGFIGSHVVDRLIEEGHQVVIVDNLATGKRKNVNRAASLYKTDITSWRLERIFRNERPNIVLHLAAQVSVRKSVEDPGFDAQVNVLGTMNVFLPDGEDVSDILLGASRARTQPLFWEWRFNVGGEPFHRSPMLAIREGDWKLLMNPDRSRIELYNIPRDPTELLNQAGSKPDMVASLSEKLLAWKNTLPRGPIHPTVGKNDYPWPGKPPATPQPKGKK